MERRDADSCTLASFLIDSYGENPQPIKLQTFTVRLERDSPSKTSLLCIQVAPGGGGAANHSLGVGKPHFSKDAEDECCFTIVAHTDGTKRSGSSRRAAVLVELNVEAENADVRDSWIQALRCVVHMTQLAATVTRDRDGKVTNLDRHRWKDDFYYWYSTQDRHAVSFGVSGADAGERGKITRRKIVDRLRFSVDWVALRSVDRVGECQPH